MDMGSKIAIGGAGEKHFEAGERSGRFLLIAEDCETKDRAEVEMDERAALWLTASIKQWYFRKHDTKRRRAK